MTEELISKLTEFTLCSGLSEEDAAEIIRVLGALNIGKRLWAARDDDGDMYLYVKKPVRMNDATWGYSVNDSEEDYYNLPADLFPSLTWNDEPKEVILSVFEI